MHNNLLSKPFLRTARNFRKMYSATSGEAVGKNEALVDILASEGIVKSPLVEQALKQVDRGDFVPYIEDAYIDSPQPIGHGATISAPHMHAYALEWLKDSFTEGGKVLDVGSGSGILCALFFKMMNSTGTVVGIEHIEELTELGRGNLAKSFQNELDEGSITLITGDGRKGYEEQSPYDVIHVGAAAPSVPQALKDQLSVGGVLMIPVGPEHGSQSIKLIRKISEDDLEEEDVLGVRYIPLCDKDHQLKYS
ncbi:unnamed protein product [Moneuplotes crassus]|uniref:Protein-L-isoaspartate O-methyltransferase n=1 Tax=Euplotes crassus TaxID=5936 RepID=A0AAD1XSN0_EUPCR|nr:unnamed protein product [Moneuplotes crassus]